MTALAVRNLTVEYRQHGGRLRAVDDLSFELEPGETLALVGESGSGKSTVVRALSRFIRPQQGQILLDGVRSGDGRAAVHEHRRRLQPVFQDPFASLNPMHTVRHHLARPLKRHRHAQGRQDLEAKVLELLRSVNLTPADEVARKYPHELSGGQRQRVAIARALATRPRVLLADEPVSMLDVSIRLEILNLLDRLKRERDLALLYVTHDLATARHFAKDIMVLYRGEVVERGPSDSVILHPAHPYTRILADAAPDPRNRRGAAASAGEASAESAAEPSTNPDPAERRRALPRVAEQHETRLDTGCKFRARCPFAMAKCESHPPAFAAHGDPRHTANCWLLEAD
jgi:peptide/nickel transport system ATP-binding protein